MVAYQLVRAHVKTMRAAYETDGPDLWISQIHLIGKIKGNSDYLGVNTRRPLDIPVNNKILSALE